MMSGAVYRPVLPDDLAELSINDNNVNNREEFVLLRNKERRDKAYAEKNANNIQPQTNVKLSNNRVLIIGLIIIVMILIAIIAIQIIRHKKFQQDNDALTPQRNKEVNKQHTTAHQKPANAAAQHEIIDNNMLQQYMRKAPPSNHQQKPAMALHNAKENFNKKEKLTSIIENTDDNHDDEVVRMRETINTLLHENYENDTVSGGNENIVNAHVIVMGEISRRKHDEAHIVLDETLTGDETDVDANADADVDADVDDDMDNHVGGKCTFILVSGKRQGQQCLRKCGDDLNRCINHKDK